MVGYFGMDNFGDDLFVKTIAADPGRYTGAEEVVFGCPPIGGIQASYSWSGRLLRKQFQNEGRIGGIVRLAVGLEGLLRCRTLVMGGGSVLSSLEGVRRVQAKLTRRSRFKWRAVSVSIGPFERNSDADEVLDFLSRFDSVAVRDERSYRLAVSKGLGQVTQNWGDIVLGSPPANVSRIPGRIVLIPCIDAPWEHHSGTILAIKEFAATEQLALDVVVLSVNSNSTHGDDEFSERCAGALSGVPVRRLRYVDIGVRETWELIGSASLVVSGRLHGIIAAMANGVPSVGFEYHQKVTDLLSDAGVGVEARISSQASVAIAREVVDRRLREAILN
ncbi:polysaccharide pyruvyl transferase family protein [Terrabacter sp. C0L_2]|uniref:polysaccharide pyruvyl transferase family protein n=1 Tax=Terrabacter sp. C0L_2 TaxID=3108389 RepID=UPI002ED602B8|nr:polysaccharide pyruvyl transferase family protein [Terrabacter sp. C0L_2]